MQITCRPIIGTLVHLQVHLSSIFSTSTVLILFEQVSTRETGRHKFVAATTSYFRLVIAKKMICIMA
jgi:hypothetical protein